MAKRKAEVVDTDVMVDLVQAQPSSGDFFQKNQKYILGAILGLLILIAGWLAYKYFVVQPNQEKAIKEMTQAQVMFEQDSFLLALTNPGAGALGFADIVKKYGSTPAGNSALYYAGVCQLQLGQFKAAISYLEDYSAAGEVMPIMKAGTLGDAYAEDGNLDKALAQYKKAAGYDNQALAPYYLKKVAMLSRSMNKMEDAKAAFESIRSTYPDAQEARDAEKYLAMMNAGN